MKKKFLIIWANSGLTTKSNHVNAPYHFIHVGEVVNFLNKKLNNSVDILDIEACQIEFSDIMKSIIDNDYKSIAFYVNTENVDNSLKILEYIKVINPKCKNIAYGELPLYLPKFFKNTKFDAIVNCNCDQEAAIMDFFQYSDYKKDINDLCGITLIINNNMMKTNSGRYLSPDEWGFTEPVESPIYKYFIMEKKEQYVMTTSRGCPYGCKYCNATLYYGKKERFRPVSQIINFINSHSFEYYKFFSPNFTLNKAMAYSLCEELIKNKKKIKWSCTTRPDLICDEKLVSLMSKSGCYKIAVGIESISQKDLSNIDKRYKNEYIIKGVSLLKKYDIEYKALVMFGLPNQTKDDIICTIEFFEQLGIKIRPTAYTPYYEMNYNMNSEQISKYDKRTYYEGIEGISYSQFLQLIYNTDNYKKILNIGELDV